MRYLLALEEIVGIGPSGSTARVAAEKEDDDEQQDDDDDLEGLVEGVRLVQSTESRSGYFKPG